MRVAGSSAAIGRIIEGGKRFGIDQLGLRDVVVAFHMLARLAHLPPCFAKMSLRSQLSSVRGLGARDVSGGGAQSASTPSLQKRRVIPAIPPSSGMGASRPTTWGTHDEQDE